MESGDLQPGDKLLQRDGKTAYIGSITQARAAATVYNFSVEDDHNYYVGTAGLLVHNCPIGPSDASKGSTGRTNVSPQEQWALDLAREYPEQGERLPLRMQDERWPAQHETLRTDDFKPKDWYDVPPDK
ncbi:polymorphic toxin-type HINT domain-containing protein [Kribbella sp. GL6]|uniref:polymorphic toxin-type HINT domain-containing protein n=1 Tax=Kribbella sp. GL6 TaxID=3419765 RepID=UPI003CFC9752